MDSVRIGTALSAVQKEQERLEYALESGTELCHSTFFERKLKKI